MPCPVSRGPRCDEPSASLPERARRAVPLRQPPGDRGTRRTLLSGLAGVAAGVTAGFTAIVRAAPEDRKRRRQRRRKRRRRAAARALYPDLTTAPLTSSGPRIDRLDDGTYVLRFTNTIWNVGEGRLELQAPTSPRTGASGQLYQNLYDVPAGGKRVSRRRVASQISYHAAHNHFHFNDFASYQLLRRDAAGSYVPIGEGTKTSFCIVDSALGTGALERQYRVCERTRQGLTPGWGDTYASNLPEQWVEIGPEPLPDGAYALRVTADPRGLLAEGGGERERNNAATGYFSVTNGTIGPVSTTPATG